MTMVLPFGGEGRWAAMTRSGSAASTAASKSFVKKVLSSIVSNFQIKNENALDAIQRRGNDAPGDSLVFGMRKIFIAHWRVGKVEDKTLRIAFVHACLGTDVYAAGDRK